MISIVELTVDVDLHNIYQRNERLHFPYSRRGWVMAGYYYRFEVRVNPIPQHLSVTSGPPPTIPPHHISTRRPTRYSHQPFGSIFISFWSRQASFYAFRASGRLSSFKFALYQLLYFHTEGGTLFTADLVQPTSRHFLVFSGRAFGYTMYSPFDKCFLWYMFAFCVSVIIPYPECHFSLNMVGMDLVSRGNCGVDLSSSERTTICGKGVNGEGKLQV